MIMMNYREMTTNELNELSRKYSNILESVSPCDDAWDEAYKEYNRINAVLDDRYREKNQEAFDKFYNEDSDWREVHNMKL